MKSNQSWHKKHRMPKKPSFEDRVVWHKEHAIQCGCRPIPSNLQVA